MKSLFYSLLSLASAHLTGISTCTDPAQPGEITFFLATYHGYTGAVAPGTVHIQNPSGATSTFSLDQSRAASPPWSGQPAIMTGSEWTSNIKSTYGFGPDVSCSHFGDKPEGELVYPVLGPDERQSCGFKTVITYYTASLSNAVSGTYRVWLTGTDAILAYQPVANKITPCEDAPLVVDLTISDGLDGCTSLPPTTTNGNPPPSYCTNVISGYRCPTTCENGYYATGYSGCNNGTWEGNFQCYDMLPCLSDDVSTVLTAEGIDQTNVIGIVGDGCDFTIANGTKCALSCTTGLMGSMPKDGEYDNNEQQYYPGGNRIAKAMCHTGENSIKILGGTDYVKVKNIRVEYFQRYGFTNHMRWFLEKKPRGHDLYHEDYFNEKIDFNYKKILQKNKKTDTLIAVAGI